ncbi:MAG TPA: ABC transporter ATP-binding protein, partial [Roseiflexaceae bacterium]|nr:ABC transporter ATP-binding protein [Roseiflexaceae bacterium]
MHAPSQSATIGSSWRYVARLIAFRPGLYILSALGIISFYLWPLLPGIFIRQIFDQLSNRTLLADEARATIWALAGVLIGVAVARSATALAYPFGEKAAMLVADTLMRHNLLRHILGQPGANALPPDSSPGEVLSRLRDDMAHISVFMTWTADPIGQLLAFGIAFVTLARIDLRITLFGFLPLVVILAFVNGLNNRIRRYRKTNQESIGRVTGLLGELFGAVQAVKVAGAETHVVAHLQRVNELRRAAALRDQLLTNLINAFSFGATNIAIGVLLILAAQSLQSGQVTVGDFALFASYLGWLAFVMGMVGGYLTKYQQVGVSLRRAVELLQGAPSTLLAQHDSDVRMRGALPAIAAPTMNDQLALRTLTVTGLTYRYPGSD